MTQLLPITIIPIETFRNQEQTTFGEVVAYLRGVADALSSRAANDGPLSVAPVASRSSIRAIGLDSEAPRSTRVTLRFGELAYERASVWPHVVVGTDWEVTRGGSRTLDFGAIDSTRSSWTALRRGTLPYEAPTISLAPRPSMIPVWVDERSSEVRLRTARLPVEWYELTGTDAATLGTPGGV